MPASAEAIPAKGADSVAPKIDDIGATDHPNAASDDHLKTRQPRKVRTIHCLVLQPMAVMAIAFLVIACLCVLLASPSTESLSQVGCLWLASIVAGRLLTFGRIVKITTLCTLAGRSWSPWRGVPREERMLLAGPLAERPIAGT